MIKNINAFISKDRLSKSIEGVLIKKDAIVATDAHRLIECKTETGVNEPVVVEMPKGLRTFESVKIEGDRVILANKGTFYTTTKLHNEYPKYEDIIPKDEPKAVLRVNPKYLKDMATAFEDCQWVEIEFHGEAKPSVFREEKKETLGLLMPMMK